MKIGTLFSGGLAAPEQALKQMGVEHEVVFACEYDKFARKNYLANHTVPEGHFYINIDKNTMNMYRHIPFTIDFCLNSKKVDSYTKKTLALHSKRFIKFLSFSPIFDGKKYNGNIDVIVGGSPCQDFSIAGLRAGIEGKRGQLIWQYFRIINEARPSVFIYENVKGMVSDKNGKTLNNFLEVFRSIGYNCHAEVLNTKDYGVPQNRERIYIVGFLDLAHYHRFALAPKEKLEKRLKDVLEDEVDEKYYLSEKMVKGFVQKADGSGYINQNTQASSVFSVEKESPSLCAGTHGYAQGYIKVEGMLNCKGTDQIRRVYGVEGIAATLTTMQGGNQEPKIYERIPLKFLDRNGKRTDGDYAFTIDTVGTGGIKEITKTETRIRKLTPLECFRLQGCDDTFVIDVSDSQAYKIAGNAMSVNVLEMIFKQIEKAQAEEPTGSLLDFA